MTDSPYAWRLAALSLAMLLPSLGTSIANVGLPTLAVAFAVPQQEAQWVVIAYLLAVTSLIVGVGRLGDLLGRRRLLLVGIATFALASAACALSPNLGLLIAARAVQGLGAAVMMALTVASVGDLVPKARTGSAMGLLGTVSATGTALGPSLGGALISWLGWPSLFAFMACAALPALVLAFLALPPDAPSIGKPTRFDLPGVLLIAVSLATYALATTVNGAQSGVPNTALAAAAVVFLVAFCFLESRSSAPLVNLSLLRERGLITGLASLAIVSTIVMATLVVGPFYLSHALRLSPFQTGMVMSVGPIIAALVGVPAGRLVDRAGSRLVMIWGLIGVGAGSILMTFLPAELGISGYVLSLAVITAGYALFQAANNTALMIDVTGERRGVVSALLNLARNLGLITGASTMGAIFAHESSLSASAGIAVTFTVAAVLAMLALAATLWGTRRSDAGVRQPEH